MVSLWWLLKKLHTTTWITHIKLISQGNFYQMIDVLYWTVKSIFSTLILCTNFWNDFFVHQDCIFEILYSFELSIKMISSSSTHLFDHKNRCWSFLFPYLFDDFCIIFRLWDSAPKTFLWECTGWAVYGLIISKTQAFYYSFLKLLRLILRICQQFNLFITYNEIKSKNMK